MCRSCNSVVFTIRRHVIGASAFFTALRLSIIPDANRFAGNRKNRRDVFPQSHTCHSDSIKYSSNNAVTAKGQNSAILREAADDNRVRHFVRGFVYLHQDELAVYITQEDLPFTDNHCVNFQSFVFRFNQVERHNPRRRGICALNRDNVVNVSRPCQNLLRYPDFCTRYQSR